MDFDSYLGTFPQIWDGLRITLLLLVIAVAVGGVLAALTAMARVAGGPVLRAIGNGYTSIMRGTPLLVQLYLLYYGVGNLLAQIPGVRQMMFWPVLRDAFWYAALTLTLSFGAYAGEILRGGIIAVPRGEVEAAAALGLRPWQAWYLVILPRAFRSCLPALGGQVISIMKSTAVASTITVMDMMGWANYIRVQTFEVYGPLLAVTTIYVALAFLLQAVFSLLERRTRLAR
jgi:polar amino acid transport system permease protein